MAFGATIGVSYRPRDIGAGGASKRVGTVDVPASAATPGGAGRGAAVSPLDLVGLTALMDRTRGRSEVTIGLIDGPVSSDHPDLAEAYLHPIPGAIAGACSSVDSGACRHGTFVAGILCAKRGSVAPAICPGCTVLVRPVFAERAAGADLMPATTPDELAAAIIACVTANVRIINLSLALARPSPNGEPALTAALDLAARRGVIVVAAAGNQGMVASTAPTRHPWVIPVAGCDLRGRPVRSTNLGGSLGRRGLRAPAEGVTSLGSDGGPAIFGGTSVAAPFVTGAIALLCSEFPDAAPADIRMAIARAHAGDRASVVPPLLDARRTFTILSTTQRRRSVG
jgi:subtilisin family serine protease